ncbi:hypothetical protein WAF17_17880 [Bernardetia sp. ABR2-2B]|uniref:hypothetical protein n=1 Tax=Bernardetia sp. ABR2-2B TaxID=3127472 RepID=UPI0030CADEC8
MIRFKKILNFACLLLVVFFFFSCDNQEREVDFAAIHQNLKNKLSKEVANHKFQDDSLQVYEKYIFYSLKEYKSEKSKIVNRGYFTLFYVQNVGDDKKVNTKDDYFKLLNTVRTDEVIETDSKMTLKFDVGTSETFQYYNREFLTQNLTIQFSITDNVSEKKMKYDTNYNYKRITNLGKTQSSYLRYEVHTGISESSKLYPQWKREDELSKEGLIYRTDNNEHYYTLELDDSELLN